MFSPPTSCLLHLHGHTGPFASLPCDQGELNSSPLLVWVDRPHAQRTEGQASIGYSAVSLGASDAAARDDAKHAQR
jgi:hypothetical protein